MSYRKALAIGVAAFVAGAAQASSHREAPFVAQHPAIDGTDFYMFNSYETGRGDYVTIIANYIPIQAPFGGPNYFQPDPNALYEINIDNTGSAKESITFQFRFQAAYGPLQVNTGTAAAPLMQSIPILTLPPSGPTSPTLNRTQTYSASVSFGGARSGNVLPIVNASNNSTVFTKPEDNIGNKSFPNYSAYAGQYVYSVNFPKCATPGKMFVGQRAESFWVNLGEVFDLVNLNPLGPVSGSPNAVGNDNITSIELEVPSECLTADGQPAASTKTPIIAGWTVSSLRQASVLNPAPTGPDTGNSAFGGSASGPIAAGGAWTQVSRLGAPLINELVIGVPDKDKFNSSKPSDDTQFINYVTNPTLAVLLNVLFGNAALVPPTPRNDIVAAFLTGVKGVNQPPNVVPGEELRLNVAIPAVPAAKQNPLGALQCFDPATGALSTSNPGCDPAGFPNGRRPGDDITNIILQVMEGALLGSNDPNYNAKTNTHPAYTDGVQVLPTTFGSTFPYLNPPLPGSPNGMNGLPADGAN
jgi:hypothetical protein